MSGRGPLAAVRILPGDAEARLLLRLRVTLAWETLRSMLGVARLRLGLVLLLGGMYWAALYILFVQAFGFLDALHADVVPLLFNAFFFSLMVMLVFSCGILLYGGMYCSSEARLLLTLPVRAEAIFGHKFQEAIWFSGLGFVLMGSPMLVAYGVERQASWPYFLLLLPFMLAFVAIPAAIGCMACMMLIAWLPRLRVHALWMAIVAACTAAVWTGWSLAAPGRVEAMSRAWFEQAFARLAITEQKLLPSWWLSCGLVEAAAVGRDFRVAPLLESLKFLAVLVANGMLLHMLASWFAGKAYRLGYSQLIGEAPRRRPRPIGWLDQALVGGSATAGRPLWVMLVKDLRLFRRDVSQWSQFLIFFGLLGLYFYNLRSFHYDRDYAAMVGFLNLAVVGLILSTFTTRFVYPMISIEGRRFWILGLLPVHRDQIVWAKFVFSFVGGVVPCCGLLLLSDWMLGMPSHLLLLHEFCCVVLCLGLSGIAVGLGARMPELRESSPAKISSGFGGTLSLVISALFIMLVVVVAALSTHVGYIVRALGPAAGAAQTLSPWAGGRGGMAVGCLVIAVLGLATTAMPLAAGIRAFRRLEP